MERLKALEDDSDIEEKMGKLAPVSDAYNFMTITEEQVKCGNCIIKWDRPVITERSRGVNFTLDVYLQYFGIHSPSVAAGESVL